MKQIVLVITSLVLLQSSGAQSNFVEVSVSDTIIATADQFLFQLMATPDFTMTETTDVAPARSRADYMRTEKEMRQKQREMLDAVEQRLKAKGFNALPVGIPDMMASRGFGNYFLNYHLPSIEALRRFQEALKDEKAVNAMLQSATTKAEEGNQKRLYSKLVERAKAKAEYLALLSGKKITGILSVSENIPPEMGGWSYGTTMTTRSSETSLNTSYPVHGRLIVRFSWN
jgi:hypothetical protein